MAEPNIGVLDQRVTGLEHGFKDLNTSLIHLSTRIDDKFGNLGTLISERSKANWPLLISIVSLMLMITSALGFLTLQPLKDRQSEIIEAQKDLRAQLVPRGEHKTLWDKADAEARYIKDTNSEAVRVLQAQIDDLKKQYSEIYNAPQHLRDITDRIRQLESMQRNTWSARTEKQ